MTILSDRSLLYRVATQEARRGGVVLLTSGRLLQPNVRRFCDGLAEQGYEVAAIGDAQLERDELRPNRPQSPHPEPVEGRGVHRACSGLVLRQAQDEAEFEVCDSTSCYPALRPIAGRLSGPLFLLSLGEVGALAWSAICSDDAVFAAASLYEPPMAALATGEPRRPTALHLTADRAAWPPNLDELGERRPDVRTFPYRAEEGFALGDSDAAHLARLRTLQLFHRSGGAKGEMGG